jgi:hypothetical protein
MKLKEMDENKMVWLGELLESEMARRPGRSSGSRSRTKGSCAKQQGGRENLSDRVNGEEKAPFVAGRNAERE